MRRCLRFEARAGHEQRDRDQAAQKRIGQIAQQPIPSLGKAFADEKQLRQRAQDQRRKAKDENKFYARQSHFPEPQPRIAIIAAVANQPQPGLNKAPGIAVTMLAKQISAIVQPFISATSKPAK